MLQILQKINLRRRRQIAGAKDDCHGHKTKNKNNQPATALVHVLELQWHHRRQSCSLLRCCLGRLLIPQPHCHLEGGPWHGMAWHWKVFLFLKPEVVASAEDHRQHDVGNNQSTCVDCQILGQKCRLAASLTSTLQLQQMTTWHGTLGCQSCSCIWPLIQWMP